MFINLAFCLAISATLDAQQERLPFAAKFRIDPTTFPKGYSFKVEMKAKIKIANFDEMAARGRQKPLEEDIIYTLVSTKSYNWIVFYGNDKPEISGSLQSVEFVFSDEQIQIPTNIITREEIEFEGSLTLLIDGEVDAVVPLNEIRLYRPSIDHVFQIKNNGMKDGELLIGLNFLPEIITREVEITTAFNPDGTMKIIKADDPSIDISKWRIKK